MSEEKNTIENEEIEETLETLNEEAEADAQAVDNELDLLQNELTALKDKYARVHADFENIKKRLEREKYTAVEYANEKFAKDMVPVIDSLEGALKSVQLMQISPNCLIN